MNIETTCNTSDDVLFGNILVNSKREIPWLKSVPEHDGHAVIIGGGPSVADHIDELRYRKSEKQTFFALNGAAKYLTGLGIDPDYTVIVDAREHNKSFIGYSWAYLISSQCHPSLLDGANVTLWHQEYPDDMARFDACLPENHPAHTLIGGGTTVGLSAMVVAYAMGYRKLHLYGYDSSYRNGATHAYKQDDPQNVACVSTVEGKSFNTSLAMAKQAELFPGLATSLIDLGCLITLRGDGLLPWTSECSSKVKEVISEEQKYQNMWNIPSYRATSPGENVASIFCLVANPSESDTVIDFGAGTGRGALKIHRQRLCSVRMLDFADNCLDAEVRKQLSERFTFEVRDLTQSILLVPRVKYGFCTDVMEHIEPEKVDAVLDNIFCAVDNAFFQISTVHDNFGALIGQHLHLTVKPFEWWQEKLSRYGVISWSDNQDAAALFYVTPSTT